MSDPADLQESLVQRVAQAAALLDGGRLEDAGELATQTIDELTRSISGDWHALDITTLRSALGNDGRAQVLARALWIASTVDDALGRVELAHRRGRRAMELYARVRMNIEELDVRAARELASASARHQT